MQGRGCPRGGGAGRGADSHPRRSGGGAGPASLASAGEVPVGPGGEGRAEPGGGREGRAGWGRGGPARARGRGRRGRCLWQSSRPGSVRRRPLHPEVTARAGPSRRPALSRRRRLSRPGSPTPRSGARSRQRPRRRRRHSACHSVLETFQRPRLWDSGAARGRRAAAPGAGPCSAAAGPCSATATGGRAQRGVAATSCAARGEVSVGRGAGAQTSPAGAPLPPPRGWRAARGAGALRPLRPPPGLWRGRPPAVPRARDGVRRAPCRLNNTRGGRSPKCRRAGGRAEAGCAFVWGGGGGRQVWGSAGRVPGPLCLPVPGLAGRTCAAAGSPWGRGAHSSLAPDGPPRTGCRRGGALGASGGPGGRSVSEAQKLLAKEVRSPRPKHEPGLGRHRWGWGALLGRRGLQRAAWGR